MTHGDGVNEELRGIYLADQVDRVDRPAPADVYRRDVARRARVAELIDSGALTSGDDFFHAAMVFHHGSTVDDHRRAHELALEAVNRGYEGVRPWHTARWLAAAAYDRWLVHQGQPQKYGTQARDIGDHRELWPVDPETTDAERARWDVRPLHESIDAQSAGSDEEGNIDHPA